MRHQPCRLVRQIGDGPHEVDLREDVGDNDHREHDYGREQCTMEDVYETAVVFQ